MRIEVRDRACPVVRAGDPCLRTEDLYEGPVGDARAVRQAAAAHEHGLVPKPCEDLANEARLSDSRLAEEREDMDGAVGLCAFDRVEEQLELAIAANECCAH